MKDATLTRWLRERFDSILFGSVLLFLLVMLLRNVGQPLLDRHSWRQVDTASFARGLAEGDFDVLHPEFLAYYPDAFGIDGATETEFNLYPLIVALVYRLFGFHEELARLVSISFSLGTAVWVYLLGRQHLDRTAGLLAMLFLGLSPLYVFYGRSVQPEAAALFLSVGALFLFTRWLATDQWGPYVGALICAALALLTKIPSLYVGLPMLGAVWMRHRWRLFRQWRVWVFGLATLAPAAIYYAHAHRIYLQTGLTVYGVRGGWPGSGKFDTMGQLLSSEFYRVMLTRFQGVILGRYAFLLLLVGLVIAPQKREERPLYVWLAGVMLFVLGVAEGNRQHEYYQLPIVPVAALFAGKALSALLKPGALRLELLLIGRHGGAALVALVLLLSLRGTLACLRPMYAQTTILLDVAQATKDLTPAGAPVAILHDWARVPEVFYYANRRGWSIWLERTPEGEYGRLIVAERIREPSGWQIANKLESGIGRFDLLRSQGASSLVVSLEKGTQEEFARSAIGGALSERYPLVGSGEHWLIYDLQHPTGESAWASRDGQPAMTDHYVCRPVARVHSWHEIGPDEAGCNVLPTALARLPKGYYYPETWPARGRAFGRGILT